MPIPVSEALDVQADAAAEKADAARRPGRFLTSSMLAGAYIGVAVVLLITATGPLAGAASPFTKLMQGLVFGIALTAVIFAGAELSTGNMMTMIHGLARRRAGVRAAVTVIGFSFAGNLIGSAGFAWLVHESGVVDSGAVAGKPAPGAALLATLVKTKVAESGTELFFRGVLCNFLVCLAVWMAARTRSDGAKLAVIFWGLLAFVASGFEHVVANMTTFSLALLEHTPGATAGAFAHNLLFVGLGNLVGGALLVGASYGWLGQPAPARARPAATTTAATTATATATTAATTAPAEPQLDPSPA